MFKREPIEKKEQKIDEIKNKYRENSSINETKNEEKNKISHMHHQKWNAKIDITKWHHKEIKQWWKRPTSKKPWIQAKKWGFKLWGEYIIKSKMRWQRMFPFTKPADALKLNWPEIEKNPAWKTPRDTLRILCFWGLEQVWINCMWFEYNDEILVVDMWLQFPNQYDHGINFRVPDLSYLNGKKVVWIAITHGHIDHIWAIPSLISLFPKGTPIFATPMAFELIKMKQKPYGFAPSLHLYSREKAVNIWSHFNALPFVVDHSIPDSIGLMITTPAWRLVHTWDWKFDNNPPEFRPSTNYKTLESIWKMWVKMLLSDSTNANMDWLSISEKEIITPLEQIFEKANWRIITATFASLIDRIALIIKISEKMWRKVVLLWKWMNDYMAIAKKLWYVMHNPETIISMDEAKDYPDDKLTICCTWAQWERYAALMRLATWESKDTELKSWDTVVFSSSVIPWNERWVQELFWFCKEKWAKIFHYRSTNIHAWGHARKEDVKKMIDLIKPEYFMPIYGERYLLFENADVARDMWYSEDKIIIWENGLVIDFKKESKVEKAGHIPARYTTVDGNMVWMTTQRETMQRFQMQNSGAVFITLIKSWDKLSIKMSTLGLPSFERHLQDLKKKILENIQINIKANKNILADQFKASKFLRRKIEWVIFSEIGKEPIVELHIIAK